MGDDERYIGFSEWPERSVGVYRKAIRQDMKELQNDLSRLSSRSQAFTVANCSVLGMLMSVVAILDLNWIVIVGFSPLFVSLFIQAESILGSKNFPAKDMWVGSDSDREGLSNDPRRLEEELMNGMVVRMDEVSGLIEKYSRCMWIGVVIFILGMLTFAVSLVWTIGL